MNKSNEALKKVFEKYATGKLINADGLEKICKELAIDLYEDIFILYFMFKCNCKTFGEVTTEEFLKGMNAFAVQCLVDLKKKIPQVKKDLEDIFKQDFKNFWTFIFTFNIEKKKTILPYDICKVYLEKLLGNYQVTIDFLDFLEKDKKGQGLNLDQWQCFLEFIRSLGKNFPKDYNVDEAWPVILDEFYYAYCEKRGISIEK